MAKLICTIDLDKEKGLIVTVEDPEGKLTQTVMLDGKAITLEVKSDSDTSTIVQKADSISVTCKAFSVDADTITLKSKKESAWTSEQTLKLESTKDMTLTSSAKLTQKATQDAVLSSSANLELKATQKLTLEGMQSQLSATGGPLKLEGVKLEMKGQSQAELGAPLIKVAAQGQLGLESSGIAELKGSMTSVSGSLVKLG
jgi:phage baseplate assembly protein gpV